MAWKWIAEDQMSILEVPGGWIYSHHTGLVFVPEPEKLKTWEGYTLGEEYHRGFVAGVKSVTLGDGYTLAEPDAEQEFERVIERIKPLVEGVEVDPEAPIEGNVALDADAAKELTILRTSLKRIAESTQNAEIISAIPAGDEFNSIPYAERGWNALAARLCDHVDAGLDYDAPDYSKAQQMYDPPRYLVIALANEKSFVATPELFITHDAAEKFAATLLTSYRIVEVITPFMEG